MSHELLEGIVRPPDVAARARRWYVLPLSIAAHAGVAAALFIIPVAAEVDPPLPARLSSRYAHVAAAPVPDIPLPRPTKPVAVRTSAAPLVAPPAIEPEKNVPVAIGTPVVPTLGDAPPGSFDGIDVDQIGPAQPIVVPPPPKPAEPRRVGGDIREPRKIYDVPPIYPPLAVAARKEGTVILEAMLDERGNVVRLKVLRSEPLLDEAALSAVRRWRYTPTLLNNVPVPVLMTITVRFTLN
jgi:protein TonB